VQTRHPVPYYSQWESAELVGEFIEGVLSASADPRWASSDASSPQEYEFWSWRTCGIACLRMVLAHRGMAVPAAVPLAEECAAAGGYVRHPDRVDGLIYAPFVAWIAERFGIKATVRAELPVAEISERVHDGGLAMISVHPWIRWLDRTPPKAGGHLVLVTGAGPGHLLIHNPSGLPGHSQQHARIALDALNRFYAGRGVLIDPP
jgi:hypothetical protein